jgi:hypothetical protein
VVEKAADFNKSRSTKSNNRQNKTLTIILMKKLLIFATCAASLSAFALPTYEPFTEYAANIATNINGPNGQTNSIDLCTAGLVAPSGEPWLCQSFSGTAGTGYAGLDIQVTNNPSSAFTYSALSSILPTTFPGFPSVGNAITTTVINPAQPLAPGATVPASNPNIVGNSAVLQFSQDFTRPASGTKTLFVSYLLSIAQQGQTGAGNVGRYMSFVASSNIVEGAGTTGFYKTFATMYNTYGVNTGPRYFGHGVINQSGADDITPTDSSAGKFPSTVLTTFPTSYNAPYFVVGEYIFTPTNSGIKDTNTIWVNPSLTSFGGPTPAGLTSYAVPMTIAMSDVNGVVLVDRPGSGQLGGVGTNYIANLLVGTTWSYVTGGPEFTSQPPTNTPVYTFANSVTVAGQATAAGQSVTYQWQKITGGVTNNLADGVGTAGGTATVTGSATTNLTLSGESAGDMGTYQVVATASGTGYTLPSTQSIIVKVTDPFINPEPQPVTVNQGGTALFSAAVTTSGGPITYQWYNGPTPLGNGTQPDGSTISGASGTVSGTSLVTTLTLTGVTYQERGNYILWVTNGNSVSISSTPAVLTVIDPYFLKQPQSSLTANPGVATNFTGAATGSGTISYLWYNQSGPLSNAGDISGVTTTNLTFSNLQLSDAGTYYLVATGSGGSTQSSNLVISILPIVTQPPNTVIVPSGGSNNIAVGTAGSGLTYQWYSTSSGQLFNTGDFGGVATSNLTIINAQNGDSGTYYVVVTWANGTEQSSNASVFVEVSTNGPFSPTNWPPTAVGSSQVDYVVFDANAATDTPNFVAPANWNNNLSLGPNSSDETYTKATTYNGLQGDTFTATYVNILDPSWQRFASYPVIDVLLQVWGNSDMYNSTNGGLPTTWTEGELWQGPYYAHNGAFPLGANNSQWNWMLLEVTNPVDSTVDSSPYVIPGDHIVGDPGNPSQGGTGGVNGGTLRLEGWAAGLTIRAIALGPQGVFGTTNEINRFAVPSNCAPEPGTNLVYVDFNKGTSNNLTVNNNAAVQETYQVVNGVGPAGDLRTAIQATSSFMEFPILNNALGLPCNENLSMQLCIEFYDDPNLAGEQFGPYAYATDPFGDIGFVPGYPSAYNQAFYTLTGTGRWLKVDWFVGPANLAGLNTAPLTGGPIVYWGLAGNPPYVDRIELGVVRNGTNALAGQIPDPSYNIDPFICDSTNNGVGYYAEWNPTAAVENNLTTATGYGTAVVGPANDQRTAEVPIPAGGNSGAYYEQFALENNAFGPVLQDNADVAMLVTYYDDPTLVSNQLILNTITTMTDGNLGTVSPTGANTYVILQGTGKWVDAYLEAPNVNFAATASFTAAPNFVCRYASSAPVYISRVRYDVIRPCGQYEGIDYLQGNLSIVRTNAGAQLGWRGTATLQGAPVVRGAYTNIATVTNTVTNAYPVPAVNNAQFFRLQFPSYPTNLSTYTPTP